MRKALIFLTIFSIANITSFSCEKSPTESTVTAPEVTTADVSAITQTTAQCGGSITSDGGAAVTARGVCWSTSQSPTIADNKTTHGTGTGSFTSYIEGLDPNTTYYIKAYATNSIDTGYGNTISFKTQSIETGTVTDIDGNTYKTVNIEGQWWMAENLKVTHYRNSDAINDQWAYGDNDSNVATYGKLYSWYAVVDERGLSPEGWHVPSLIEWYIVSTILGGLEVAGGKMKETGTAHWISPNTGATNKSEFTALPGGYYSKDGNYVSIGYSAFFWTSTTFHTGIGGSAWYFDLSYNYSHIRDKFTMKEKGYSIRCVKDY